MADETSVPSSPPATLAAEDPGRYRALFRSLPAMVHSIDAEGNIVEVSQKWLDTLGYSYAEVIGRKSADFLTAESRRFAVETVLPAFFRSGECTDVPYQLVTRDGQILDVLLSATCERDAEGQVTRSIAVMQDVTARKKAELAQQAAKDYAENLLQTANVMVVELDPAGLVRRLNPAAERATGYEQAEIQGRNWFETIVPRTRYPQVWQVFEQLLKEGRGDEFENPILTRNGEERQVAWRNSPVVENGKLVGTLSVGIDVTPQRATERRLAVSEAALKEAQAVAHIGSWVLDHASGDLIWSDEIFRILEIDRAAGATNDAFLAVVHPQDRDDVKRAYKRSLIGRRPYEIRHRLQLPDGTIKYVHQHSATTFTPDGAPLRSLGTIQDVTLEVLQEMAFQESEERFRTIADYTYDWEYWVGTRREILYISPSCLRVSGYSQAEFISDPGLTERIIHPDDRERFAAHYQEAKNQAESHINFRIIRKDGQICWIAHGCRAVTSVNGEPRGRRVSNRDITDLKHAEQLAQQLAHFDTLTNLPNRRMLMDRLLHGLAQAKRSHHPLVVMFLDLDRFKQINDTLGHDFGDKLLVGVAQRLTACVRTGDTVSRSGGDEFILVLPEIAAAGDAEVVAQKLVTALNEPFSIDGHSLVVTVSIGIAIYSGTGNDSATDLMKHADVAMYAAKQAGRNGYRVFIGLPPP